MIADLEQAQLQAQTEYASLDVQHTVLTTDYNQLENENAELWAKNEQLQKQLDRIVTGAQGMRDLIHAVGGLGM